MFDKINKHLIVALVVSFLVLDLLSIISYFYPIGQIIIFGLIIITFVYACFKNIAWAVAAVIIELILGSQGYWFFVDINGSHLPLRIIFFVILWSRFITSIKLGDLTSLVRQSFFKWWSLGLLGIVLGMVMGFRNGFGNWFLDVNGYLFIFYLIPLWHWRKHWFENFIALVIAALIYLSFKTTALLYLYTHFTAFDLLPVYNWIRNTGFGEITYAGGGWFRIFSQSHIFAATATAALWLWPLVNKSKLYLSNYSWLASTSVVTAILFASMSRSFWLGTFLAILCLVVYLWVKSQVNFREIFYWLTSGLVIILLSLGLLIMVVKFPWPTPLSGDLGALINRTGQGVGEAATESRLKLLDPLVVQIKKNWLLGQGFGATVTYLSSDPRIVRSSAGGTGLVTTYSFEWGYLDMWLKMGLIGIGLYLLFWVQLFKLSINSSLSKSVLVSTIAAALTVVFVNITTPYMNHPLGIGSLMLLAIYLFEYNEHAEAN